MSRRAAIRPKNIEAPAPTGRQRRPAKPREAASPPADVTEQANLSEPAGPTGLNHDLPPSHATGRHSDPDRRRLHAEMIEMRERYVGGAAEAATNLGRFQELSARAKTLLDEEFPGWEEEPDQRRSDMVTLYFQYQADAERAGAIQDKFERLTRDIEILLSEEFPDWKS